MNLFLYVVSRKFPLAVTYINRIRFTHGEYIARARLSRKSKRSRRLATLSFMGVTHKLRRKRRPVCVPSWFVDFTAAIESLAFQAVCIFPPRTARFLRWRSAASVRLCHFLVVFFLRYYTDQRY